MICEFEDCESKKDAEVVLRLMSIHGYYQNPMRLGSRVPAKVAVCRKCAEYLRNDSQLKWEWDSEFTGKLNATGSTRLGDYGKEVGK